MQVKQIKTQPSFKPISFELTFDTAEELTVIRDMLRLDASISEIVYPGDKHTQRVLSATMKSIFDVISDVE